MRNICGFKCVSVCRLKSVQVLLSTVEEVRSLVDDYEQALASHDALSVDSTQLQVMRQQIQVSTLKGHISYTVCG